MGAFENTISKKSKSMIMNLLLMYICMPAATLYMIISVFYAGINFKGTLQQNIMLAACILFLLCGNVLIFYAFHKYTKQMREKYRQNIEAIKKECEQTRQHDRQKKKERYQKFINKIINYLKTLDILVKAGDKEQAKEVIMQLNAELERNALTNYSSNSILNAILSDKKFKAEELNVSMDIFVEPNVSLKQVKDIDLIAMIGNLLDNAVRAAGECEKDKQVRVRMYMQNNGNVFVAKLENHYVKLIKDINGELKTTKENAEIHGLGIKSVVITAQKYDGYFKYSAKDNKFTAILQLPI